MNNNKEIIHYGSIDGLRAFSCIGIMIMHVMANTDFSFTGIIWERIIPSFNWLVFLFMMISGFCICAGYLDKFQNGTICLEYFFLKRYKKILPFFSFLILLSCIIQPSITNFFDAFFEITLLYGFLPVNSLNVIGVGWTLGVIFLFYLFFPFFSIILKNLKRAFFCLIISFIITFLCENYYFISFFESNTFISSHSFIYCFPLFISGGIIYLLRNEISSFISSYKIISFVIVIFVSVISFFVPWSIGKYDIHFFKYFFMYFIWLGYCVGRDNKFLNNKITNFFSNISMEFYLSHMFVFRFIELFKLQYLFGKSILSFLFSCFIICIGVIILVYGYNNLFIKGIKLIINKSKSFCRTKFL